MKIAIFSDIHGNSIGLDAVLADIKAKGGVDHYWVLGDFVASGPDPVGVIERLHALPNAEFIRGNTDRYIYSGSRPPPHADEVAADPSLLPVFAEIHGNFAWTTGILAEHGSIKWFEGLPFDISMTLPDGTRMWGIHCSPWNDDDRVGFCPRLSDAEIEAYANACDADLTFCSHTHWPWRVKVGKKQIINVGSVGLPLAESLNACWTLLTANLTGYQIEQFEVSYDRQAVIEATSAKKQPGAKYINSGYRGERIHPWKREEKEGTIDYEFKSRNY